MHRAVLEFQARDFHDTFSPIARYSTVCLLLAVSATMDYELHHFDVETAFLNGVLDEDIYMRVPQGVEVDSGMVLKLNKAIYGTKQASRIWNANLHATFTDFKFKQSTSDSCLYVLANDDVFCAIVVIVDDLLMACSSMDFIKAFGERLSKVYSISDKGPLTWSLGIHIFRNRQSHTIKLTQSIYIEQVLTRFGMKNCNPTSVPANTSVHLVPTTDKDELAPEPLYRALVGCLLYLANTTRPDIAMAVGSCARFVSKPSLTHWKAAKHILRYLRGTSDLGLTFCRLNGVDCQRITGWSDSDWANDRSTRRSRTGYVFQFGVSTISWRSKLQPTVARSTVEAEYMAMADAAQEAVWIRRLISDFGFEQKSSTVLFVDNAGSIALVKNPVFHNRTKHIDIRYHFTRECVTSGTITVDKVPTSQNTADILTKPLSKHIFCRLRSTLVG